ncbi:alpha/beta hydrolase [Lewinella sp. W8]|uniref:alpha/beta hydrolase n=1 Tax=Lewinella sp. W8 TaxID=2528208 RepID=UPI0010680DF7|nr:alpha/beta hydrolase [Lewinella sp. W8]MTB50437.1 alpha/beta hydrolase fold domain-containing protein [Lewinella sp. W8]
MVRPSGKLQQPDRSAHDFLLAQDVIWASPRGFDLTMDIYTPQTAKTAYPVIIIYHGGGWLINDKGIMEDAAAYLASHGEYVICNVNYRLLGDLNNTVTMDEIIGDAFGAALWVMDNIAEYGGDPHQLIVTGDSAGGHLATLVATEGHRTGDQQFEAPHFGFRPSYIPSSDWEGKQLSVKAALISYGAFDLYAAAKTDFEGPENDLWARGETVPRGIFGNHRNPETDAEYYYAVSPLYLVAPASAVTYPPMLFTVGARDNITTPASIQKYIEKLQQAGHRDLTYWVHDDRPHAFLDSGSNDLLETEFNKDAVPALEYMLDFLEHLF